MAHSDLPTPSREAVLAERVGLAAVLAFAWAVRLWIAFHDDGIYWPDEIFQSLEPAHRGVYGYGFVPWEFIDGARNWAFPGVIAGLMELARRLGLNAPEQYLAVVRTAMALTGVMSGWGVFVLVRRLGRRDGPSAWVAMALYLFCPPALYFSHRALSETASALPVVWGLALALPTSSTRRERLFGTALLALATLLRLQAGVFCAVWLGVLLIRRAYRPLVDALAVLFLGALVYGALDFWTWGRPFHSAIVYLRFNLIEGKASGWGTAAPSYYARVLFTSMPVTFVAVTLGVLRGVSRARALTVATACFLGLHALIPHKELRFVLPALPLVFALAGVGFGVWSEQMPRSALLAAGVAVVLVSGMRFRSLTFGALGQYEADRPHASAYDDFGAVNRLLLAAHASAPLCGLKVEVAHLAWTGGYTYLHRQVPFFGPNGPPRSLGQFNEVITVPEGARGARVLATDGGLVLAQLFEGPCQPAPGFTERLP